jgi:hypothetical protein
MKLTVIFLDKQIKSWCQGQVGETPTFYLLNKLIFHCPFKGLFKFFGIEIGCSTFSEALSEFVKKLVNHGVALYKVERPLS